MSGASCEVRNMRWADDWPTVLMWASGALFVATLLAIVRFVRNSSDWGGPCDWPQSKAPRETDSNRSRSVQGFILLGLLVILVVAMVAATALAHAPDRERPLPPNGVLWSAEALLRDFFPSSNQVVYRKIALAPEEQAQLTDLTGADRENGFHLVYVAHTGTRVDGYALLNEGTSARAPASFGVQLGADGRVKRVEVMQLVDREQRVVLDRRFLHQYEGRSLPDAVRLHRRIDRPRGCTSACTDATKVVKRALFVVSKMLSDSSPWPVSPPSSEDSTR